MVVYTPTVSLDIISLVASSCGYSRGQTEQCAAHAFAVHVATQRGLAQRLPHRHPPRDQPVAPKRGRHCRRPRLIREVAPLRHPLAIRDNPIAHTGGATTPSSHNSTGCAARLSLLFSPPGNGFSTLDARWKLLIGQYTSGIIRGDTVGLYGRGSVVTGSSTAFGR